MMTDAQLRAMKYGAFSAIGSRAVLEKLQSKGYVGKIVKNPQHDKHPDDPKWKAEKTAKGMKAEEKAVAERGRKTRERERSSRMESRSRQFEESERARLRRALKDV